MIIAPPFWRIAGGDHAPGDGLTALQCTFDGASGADVSGNAVPVTQNGGTLYAGYYEVDFTLGMATNPGIYWGGAGPKCARTAAGEAYTVEFFFKLTRHVDGNNGSSQTLHNMDNLTSSMTGGSAPIGWNKTGAYAAPQHSYFSSVYGAPANVALPLNTMQHIAFTWGTDSYWRAFRNGVLIAGPVLDASYWIGGNVQTGFISPSLPNYWTDFTYQSFGTRIRRAKMYNDAGFTPPALPAAWGAP